MKLLCTIKLLSLAFFCAVVVLGSLFSSQPHQRGDIEADMKVTETVISEPVKNVAQEGGSF